MNSVKSSMYQTYVFTNMYLEGVRVSVQGAHALARLVVLHFEDDATLERLTS